MNRTVGIALIVGVGILIGFRACSASAEEEVWNLFEDMAEGFSDGSGRRAVEGLDPKFVDPESRQKKSDLLRWIVFLARKHANDQDGFPYRVEMIRHLSDIKVDEDAAEATVLARMEKRVDGVWGHPWELWITAVLERRNGDWRIMKATRETREGTPPF